MNELISVIMSEYNTKYDALNKSINSILNQTYNNFEIIIIDDKTNEKNKSYLNELQKKHDNIKVISNNKNLGLAASLNKAISFSSGEYIFRMDTDDIALPHRFEHQLDILKKGYDITTGRVIVIDEEGLEVGRTKNLPFYNVVKSILLYYLYSNGVIHPLIACKRKVLEEFKYDEEIRYAQDFELWLRMSHKYKIFFDEEILLKYRRENKFNSEKLLSQYQNHTLASLEDVGKNPIKKIGFEISKWRYKKNIINRLNIDKQALEELLKKK